MSNIPHPTFSLANPTEDPSTPEGCLSNILPFIGLGTAWGAVILLRWLVQL